MTNPPTKPTAPLSEEALAEIEQRKPLTHHGGNIWLSTAERDALCQSLRAAVARIEALTTDWCECEHVIGSHSFFSDHDECSECDPASDDLCCEWRPAPRPNENAALRDQLAQGQTGVLALIKLVGVNAVSKPTDAFALLTASIAELQSRLAQVEKERNEFRAKAMTPLI